MHPRPRLVRELPRLPRVDRRILRLQPFPLRALPFFFLRRARPLRCAVQVQNVLVMLGGRRQVPDDAGDGSGVVGEFVDIVGVELLLERVAAQMGLLHVAGAMVARALEDAARTRDGLRTCGRKKTTLWKQIEIKKIRKIRRGCAGRRFLLQRLTGVR